MYRSPGRVVFTCWSIFSVLGPFSLFSLSYAHLSIKYEIK
ncbi:hypothetical protein F383_19522 [Gossypium arboreum]|uniref:Uncharacterized protein n=1 Tax=Gossypium arboreum TaxID=29729 RepID=A0A0B0NSE2_GOSAR|nr:hypothetical protein F383_19522 [Gossypium arboreum]